MKLLTLNHSVASRRCWFRNPEGAQMPHIQLGGAQKHDSSGNL